MDCSVKVPRELQDQVDVSKTDCHLLPCKIKYSGPAQIKNYFHPYIKRDGDNVLRCSFRGRPLLGEKIQVPDGYTGLVLKKEKNVKRLDLNGEKKFSSFTYWNLDKEPSKNDMLLKLSDMLQIHEVMHSTPSQKSEDD